MLALLKAAERGAECISLRPWLARPNLSYHDPYVEQWQPDGEPVPRVTDLDAEIARADLVILLQDHSAYDLERIAREARLVLDTRGRLEGPAVETL